MTKLLYSAAQLGKVMSVTSRRVQQLVEEEVIPKPSGGKYDVLPCVTGYIKYLKELSDGKEVSRDVKEERGRLLKAQADKTEIEVDMLRGNLLSADEVELAWSNIVSSFRSRMLALPSRATLAIIGEKDRNVVESTLRDLIYEALGEMSKYGETQISHSEDVEAGCPAPENHGEPVGG